MLRRLLSGRGVCCLDGQRTQPSAANAKSAKSNPGTTMQLKNVAAVIVTATLPAFAQPGQNIDIDVSSIANAKSLLDSGLFYPLAINTAEERLRYYATQFQLVEVDSSYYAMPYAERYIWGATAGMLRVLYERICAS